MGRRRGRDRRRRRHLHATSSPRTSCRSRRSADWTGSRSSAIVAADEAIEQAGWDGELPYDSMRIGCIIATGIGGIETVETQHDVMRDRGAKMVSPLGIPLYMPNAGAAAVSMKHGLQGQMYGLVSACSGGAHAIGSALRMIQYGDADAVVAGRRRGGTDGVRVRVLQLDAGVVSDRHVAAVRRPPRRVRDGRGRRRDGARGRGGRARAWRHDPGRGDRVRLDLRRLPPDRAAARWCAGRASDRTGARGRGRDPGRSRLRQRPRDFDAAQRRGRDRRAEACPRRGSRQADPGVLDEVLDRAPARRCRRGRGGGDDRRRWTPA